MHPHTLWVKRDAVESHGCQKIIRLIKIICHYPDKEDSGFFDAIKREDREKNAKTDKEKKL